MYHFSVLLIEAAVETRMAFCDVTKGTFLCNWMLWHFPEMQMAWAIIIFCKCINRDCARSSFPTYIFFLLLPWQTCQCVYISDTAKQLMSPAKQFVNVYWSVEQLLNFDWTIRTTICRVFKRTICIAICRMIQKMIYNSVVNSCR